LPDPFDGGRDRISRTDVASQAGDGPTIQRM
jgi:hypothetical protein